MKNSNLLTLILLVIGVFVAGVMLNELRAVLLPFTLALLLSIIFKPVVLKLKSKRLPMAITLFGVLLISFFVLFLVGWIVFSSVQSFVAAMPAYEARFSIVLSNLQATAVEWADRFDIPVSDFRWSGICYGHVRANGERVKPGAHCKIGDLYCSWCESKSYGNWTCRGSSESTQYGRYEA